MMQGWVDEYAQSVLAVMCVMIAMGLGVLACDVGWGYAARTHTSTDRVACTYAGAIHPQGTIHFCVDTETYTCFYAHRASMLRVPCERGKTP